MRTWKKSKGNELDSPGTTAESRNSGRTTWIWTERLLFVCGLALMAIYGAVRVDGILRSRAALEEFVALESAATTGNNDGDEIAPSRATNPAVEIESPEIGFRLWDRRRVQAYKESTARQSGAALGVLRISKIHLEAPVLDGADDVTLNRGVGWIAGTARLGEQGNIGIAGHRDGFFRGLKDVTTGDAIELETLGGRDTYVVDRIQIVTPDNVDVLRPTRVSSLTLVTCYPFYVFGSAPKRYIVTASLTREIKSGAENSTLSPLSAMSSPIRRNHEQSE
jgi:sortase A